MRIKLIEEDEDGIGEEITDSPLLPVLRKPNHFQNRIKFIEQWMVSKLLYGNTYVLKRRDGRGLVNGLYVLDPQRVTPLVTETGEVYYQLATDNLSGLTEKSITVPAREIIHDMMVSLWHPLVGVSPIYACGLSATQGRKIQSNSTKFFDNMSRPSGGLSAPGKIDNETAERLKATFEQNYSGQNIGRLFVAGDGLTYVPMTIPAQEAQLIEQLRWTVEDVARCFHMPMFKLGGPLPAVDAVDALNLTYYNDCLQAPIEGLELALDEGLALPPNRYIECDLENLMRMDQQRQITMLSESVKGSLRMVNEARKKLGLKPVAGGDTVYSQQQNFSLAALAKRDAKADPFATSTPPPKPPPDEKPEAANDEDGAEDVAALANIYVAGLDA